MGYVKGVGREQGTLFPVTLDELVPAEHMVRVIDLWVGSLNLERLGFAKAQPAATGRPPYDPSDLLKLYLYGYLNQVRSSRRLERECRRNIEVMWLMGRLVPDHKTIASFRRANGEGFVALCRSFVGFCRHEELIRGELVAIDGSKFQAVASKRQVVSCKKLTRQLEAIDADIAKYLAELDAADQVDKESESPSREALKGALERLKGRRADVVCTQALMEAMDLEHHVLGEGEARLMKTGQGSSKVAYNVQSVVDAEHGLILNHQVTQEVSDNRLLAPMAEAAKKTLEAQSLTVVADAGFSSGEQLAACEAVGITAFVPPNRSVNNQGDGTFFPKSAFVFDEVRDGYQCPGGQWLVRKQSKSKERIVTYAGTACTTCTLKTRCTHAKQRFVGRHMDEAALERARARCEAHPEMMRRRRALVEHPFGTLKERILGNGRFLLRGLAGARTEFSLAALVYNFKRVTNILGVAAMATAVAA
jgi:transposase